MAKQNICCCFAFAATHDRDSFVSLCSSICCLFFFRSWFSALMAADDFQRRVMQRDQEATNAYNMQSKKTRVNLRCWWKAETVFMGKADRDSKIWQAIDKRLEDSQRATAEALAPSEPKFHAGQSVLQWWATWMKSATHPPKRYNKKDRPWWFSAEVLSIAGYGTITYAGEKWTGSLYHVY